MPYAPRERRCRFPTPQRTVGLQTYATRARIHVVQTTQPQSSAHGGEDPHDRDALTLVNDQRVITAHTVWCAFPGGVDGAFTIAPRGAGRSFTRFQTGGA